MNISKKHHYLPQFYLKNFSADNKMVYQVEKTSTCKAYYVAITDAAAIHGYHKLDNKNAKDENELEKLISKIETDHSLIVKQIINDGIVKKELKPRIVEFISIMRFRVPPFKEYIEEFLKNVVTSSTEIMRRNCVLPQIEEFGKKHFKDIYNITIYNWKILTEMYKIALDKDIVNILSKMNITLLSTEKTVEFLTCDQPVVFFNPHVKKNDPYGLSLTDRSTVLTLPLSRYLVIQLSWNKDFPDKKQLSVEEVNELNRREIIMANNYIFCSKKSTEVRNKVVAYTHCSAGFKSNMEDWQDSFYLISKFCPVMNDSEYNSLG
ncbi:MAG: DUF4238 domain-containing protein [Candidatus Anammoxibacter sp.]